MSDWQLIETAPKKERQLVWLWDGETRWIGHFRKGLFESYPDAWAAMAVLKNDGSIASTSVVIKPTHWRPLPEPPQ